MATWGAHFRIAEKILQQTCCLDEEAFLVGNIGPDCGMLTGEWDKFDPPKAVSHWKNASNKTDPEPYYQKYLSDADKSDHHRYSFLVGYYVHLISDAAWSKLYLQLKREQLSEFADFGRDKNLTMAVKRDWYDQDYLYLVTNPRNIFHDLFTKIESFPDYLDYFPAGAVEFQMKEIQKFYLNYKHNPFRDYRYLTVDEMNNYVEQAVELSVTELLNKNLISGIKYA